jgi:hypothetical protein
MLNFRSAILSFIALCALLLSAHAHAQIKPIDPNSGLGGPVPAAQTAPPETTPPVSADDPNADLPPPPASPQDGPPVTPDSNPSTPGDPNFPAPTTTDSAGADTYKKDDLIGAAEGVFGKGAEGLARIIEDVLKDQGQPNGYIVGREAGGALVVGVRYGSGKLMHKVEGEQDAYWTGPSVGFDAGANAAKTFVLVYNLYDTEDLYKRFPAGEGNAYFVGGFTASYLRRGDVVLIPIRLGVGVRLGANVGYMKFTKKQNWLPF